MIRVSRFLGKHPAGRFWLNEISPNRSLAHNCGRPRAVITNAEFFILARSSFDEQVFAGI